MEFPKRGSHDFWNNPEPIMDMHEALALLAAESSSLEPHHLARNTQEPGWDWEIVVPWSGNRDTSGIDYYQIDSDLAAQLVKEGLVEPFVVKDWGSSRSDPKRLVPTTEAKTSVRKHEQTLRKQAQSMLIPGTHTDLTGAASEGRWGREHFRFGPFYVEFGLPLGGTCHVYPEQGEIVMPTVSDAVTI